MDMDILLFCFEEIYPNILRVREEKKKKKKSAGNDISINKFKTKK